jgi:aspartate kinase
MVRIVQKYGGTSLRNIKCIGTVAKNVKAAWENGNEMIVVVSARAGVTDRLIGEAKRLSSFPSVRELDALLCTGEQETATLLAIALNEMGVPAASQLAFQADIRTCSSHGNARIKNIGGGDIEKLLARKTVVIVSGFQGITEHGDLTTLGRGGSDLTALTLAHRFKADKCEIYTDVPGLHTGDPRMVKNARLIEKIDFESMLRLSLFDNKIMQDRSVAFAKRMGVSFTISSIFSKVGKTVVEELSYAHEYESPIVGITSKTDLCLVSCESNDDVAFDILKFFKEKNVDVGFVKHRHGDASFFDEISMESVDFRNLMTPFRNEFHGYFEKFDVVENLSRIDAIGANIMASDEIFHIFGAIPRHTILRSEYGRHGLSVLIQSDAEQYQALLNDVHDSVFVNQGVKSV